VLENDAANYRVFNVGTGRATAVFDFASMLRDAYGVTVDPQTKREYRPMDCRHLVCDNSKIVALGWQPTFSVQEGVRRYAEWILSKPRPAEYFSSAEQKLRALRIVRTLEAPPVVSN
jgi:UDP-glucose 4-epimerase